MSKFDRFFVALISIFFCTNAHAADWTWGGFEVLGNHSVGREEIIKKIPLQVGEKYKEDISAWTKWCERLVQTYSFSSAECSGVRYSDFQAFFVVDVVEKGQEHRFKFRPTPTRDLTLANDRVMTTYQNLQKRLWYLFSQGKPSSESWSHGYLDYADPEMHQMVLELVKLTPPYRKNIIRVLREDKDPSKRMAAADLLNWAGKGSKSVLRTHTLLDDPHSGVRNQLARFMHHFVGSIRSENKLRAIIDSLLVQLDRPSHGDRNKALFNLFEILKHRPELTQYIKEKGQPLIQYTADTSVLSNVGGLAKEILALLGRTPSVGPAPRSKPVKNLTS